MGAHQLFSWENGAYGKIKYAFAGSPRAGGSVGAGSSETLRKWVRQSERDTGVRPGLTTEQVEELQQLRRENRELRRANEILRKASAYFAQAELDRLSRR